MLLQDVTFSCVYDYKIMFLRFLFYTWDYRICPSMKFVDKPSNILHRNFLSTKLFFFFIRSPQLEEPLGFCFFCCEYLLFFLFFPLLTLIENAQKRTLHTFFKLRYGTSAFPTEILIWVIFSLTKYIKCTVIKKRQKILLHISNVFYLRFSSSGATFTQHFRKPSKTITGVTDLWIIFMNRKHLKLMIVLL